MKKLYLKIQARNKAKEDIDLLMRQQGFKNVAIGSNWNGSLGRFFSKLFTVTSLPFRVSKGDVLLVQYPFKKYYPSVCRIVHAKGGKVVTLIHDLGCFRRKKLTPEHEVKKLSGSDILIVHNDSMLSFLKENNYAKPMLTLEIFDYIANTEPQSLPSFPTDGKFDVVYAGGLAERKSKFLYILDQTLPQDCNWTLLIHGKGLNETKAATWTHIKSEGFTVPDEFVRSAVGHFGLVWDGAGIDGCTGNWGEYLRVNNPHKASFYLRSGKPVIIWKQAAMASFVESKGLGFTVESLGEVSEKLASLTESDYNAMVERVQEMRHLLAEGHYFYKAYDKALNMLGLNNQ